MSNTTTRVVYYRRCNWKQGHNHLQNLQHHLAETFGKLSTCGSRTVETFDGEVMLSVFIDEAKYFFGEITYSVTDGQMPIQKDLRAEQTLPLEATPPPQGHKFVKKYAYFLVVQNHFVFCCQNCRFALLDYYLSKTIDTDLYKVLSIDPVIPSDILKRIQRDGVDRIDLASTAYEASLLRATNQQHTSRLKNFINDISSLASPMFHPDGDQNRANSHIGISISFSKKKKGYCDLEQQTEELTNFVSAILPHEDGSDDILKCITTSKGDKIKPNELIISKVIRFEQLAKDAGLDRQDVKDKLYQYYKSLEENGTLES